MKVIAKLRDLEQFGIVPLTGEADALGFRVLCDLTARGRRIVAETLGIGECAFHKNWNSGSSAGEHVASVMLPHDAAKSIGVIALFDAGCHTVIQDECGVLNGLTGDDNFEDAHFHWDEETNDVVQDDPAKITERGFEMPWPSCYGKIVRVFRFGNNPRVGTRNVHAMSGRTE